MFKWFFNKVIKVWRNNHSADQFIVQELAQKIGVDGLLLGDLTEWTREKVDRSSQGSSSTQIGFRICIYSAKTGVLAWESQKLVRKEAARVGLEQLGGDSQASHAEGQDSSGARWGQRHTSDWSRKRDLVYGEDRFQRGRANDGPVA